MNVPMRRHLENRMRLFFLHMMCMVPTQTSINAEGFRSLREGEEVEYEVEAGPDGRTKAISVTGPEGAAPQVRILGFCSQARHVCTNMRASTFQAVAPVAHPGITFSCIIVLA